MTDKNKDVLANLISCELNRMGMIMQQAEKEGNAKAIKYWTKEIQDLKELDAEINDVIK